MDAVIIRNPISGNPKKQRAFDRAVAAFREAGWQVAVWVTEYKGHSRELAERAVQAGYKRIVIAGGDGSIGQAVDGLLKSGSSDVALGVIPLGTGNVFAREVGLPFPKRGCDDAPARAARIIIENDPVRVDVGRVDGNRFLCWAGVGLDAAATCQVESHLEFKRRLPLFSYVVMVLRVLAAYQPKPTRITLEDGEVLAGSFPVVVVSNIQLYARYFRLAPAAKIDDGLLDLLVFEEQSKISILHQLFKVALSPGAETRGITRRSVRQVRIETTPPQPYHLDGDPLGQTPITIEVVPRGLLLHLDQQRSAHLFTSLLPSHSAHASL